MLSAKRTNARKMLFQETVGLYGTKRKFGSLRAAFGRKVAEIWAKQPDLQPVHE